jgi:hypothetical protein
MTSLRTLRVDTDGAQLEVRDRGEGEPVVFIHGSMPDECAAVVKEPALVKRFRVIDYHRRGWGSSSRAVGPVSIGQGVEDCRGILRQLRVERAHFAGQSSGGAVPTSSRAIPCARDRRQRRRHPGPRGDRLSSTAHAPPLIGPGVASRPAVVAEVIVRHPLGPVLLTGYGSPWESRSSSAPDVRLIPHRRRRQPMRSARDTMIPSGPRT